MSDSCTWPALATITLLLLAGCAEPINNIDTTEQNQEEILTETDVQFTEKREDTNTPTEEQTRSSIKITDNVIEDNATTETVTQTSPANWSRKVKYKNFEQNYINAISDNVSIHSSEIHPKNKSMSISYVVNPGQNSTKNPELYIIVGYANVAESYHTTDSPSYFDEEWVPKYVNVNVVTQKGEVHRSGCIKYEKIYKCELGSGWDTSKVNDETAYALKYYNTTKIGPAHPEYAGS